MGQVPRLELRIRVRVPAVLDLEFWAQTPGSPRQERVLPTRVLPRATRVRQVRSQSGSASVPPDRVRRLPRPARRVRTATPHWQTEPAGLDRLWPAPFVTEEALPEEGFHRSYGGLTMALLCCVDWRLQGSAFRESFRSQIWETFPVRI